MPSEKVNAEENDNTFIVFRGLPRTFGKNLNEAEEWAASKSEEFHEDYTVTTISRKNLEQMALVARYHGVVLHSLKEIDSEDSASRG